MREVTISRGEASRRLDKYLMKYLNAAPPGFIYKMLRKKRIKLNGARAAGGEILCGGDVITLYLSDETVSAFTEERAAPAAAGGLDIIFEDEDILLVNKPPGMLVHSASPADTDNLAGRLAYYLSGKGAEGRAFTPAPSNRLDRNTSGIVYCGKHPAAVRALNEARAEKRYLAAVWGEIRKPERLAGYIYKDPGNNESVVKDRPFDGSKEIVTEYAPIGWGEGITLLRVTLVTGKSHQIRAHLKAAGIPVLGDPKYGDRRINEQFRLRYQLLHAERLTFTGNPGILEKYNNTTFYAPAPAFFASFIKQKIGVFTDESHNFSRGIRDQALPPHPGQA